MPERQEQFNLLLDSLEPAERDQLKQAVRDILLKSLRVPDTESSPDLAPA
jgi:hypothetical protein